MRGGLTGFLAPALLFLGLGEALAQGVVTRGPYLQRATPNSVIVRWRTDLSTDSRVRYGTQPAMLTSSASVPAASTNHEVALTGLQPATRYYYDVGSSTAVQAGGVDFSFVTPPSAGAAAPTRIWVIGDSGTADANARAVRDAYRNYAGGAYTNLWLMLGDNAYQNGTDAEYETAVFDTYPEMLRQTVLWPTLGNHDGGSADSGTQTGPYYAIFTLPKAGEAGGLASGTEAYYSFDYANIHFICLDSFDSSRATGGAMLTWLQADLAATDREWIIAFWHHPPYSKGSHDSDTELELREMRQNALPILEQGGVDLVLAGHSHSYERSFLLDGHYGTSGTLTGAMKKNAGDGRLDGQGAYGKPTAGQAPHEGAVYLVAGSSGSIAGGLLNHPAMYLSLNSLGSLAIDLNGHQLDATFLNSTGTVLDTFTLLKGPASPPDAALSATPASGNAPLTVQFADRSTGGPTSWTWDIDDDGDVDSQVRNPRQTYTLPGLFSVRLSVANAQGVDTTIATNLVCVKSANGLADADGDGTSDGADHCPCVFDPGQQDTDQDGAGDACDPDDDNDGLLDELDCTPLDPVNNTPPGDVGSTLVLGPANDAIAWAPVPMATTYNVYRGSLAPEGPFAYDHACFETQSPDPASADPESPAEGWGFYYLVNARNACGEGPLGSDSTGGPIPSAAACP